MKWMKMIWNLVLNLDFVELTDLSRIIIVLISLQLVNWPCVLIFLEFRIGTLWIKFRVKINKFWILWMEYFEFLWMGDFEFCEWKILNFVNGRFWIANGKFWILWMGDFEFLRMDNFKFLWIGDFEFLRMDNFEFLWMGDFEFLRMDNFEFLWMGDFEFLRMDNFKFFCEYKILNFCE